MPAVQFEFAHHHIHAGVHYAPGDVAELTESQALKLRERGVGRLIEPAVAKPPRPRSRKANPATTATED